MARANWKAVVPGFGRFRYFSLLITRLLLLRASMDDKTLRCRAQKGKWIAGDQCQLGVAAGFKNAGFGRVDNLGIRDEVVKGAGWSGQLDPVAQVDIPEFPEERVTVSGNDDVSVGTGK
jgi:hypothetical protein